MTRNAATTGDYVTVKVCADSGMLAGKNCPNVVTKRVPVDQVPTEICRLKHGR